MLFRRPSTAVLVAGALLCVPLASSAEAQAPAATSPPAATPPAATPPVAAPSVGTPVPGSTPPAEAPKAPSAPDAAAVETPKTVPKADPVVATVNGHPLRLSDVAEAAQGLPEQMRGMPSNVLYPLLLDQVIDREALVLQARREGLEKEPLVADQMRRAADTALQNALIAREVGPTVTEAAIRARYDQTIAGKPGEEEVDAQHILVPTEKEADDIIAQLNKGADFAALAKKYSTDHAAGEGGDLGFFKKGDMLPEFADAAFALKPGQFTEKPVHTRFGWHVIKVIARRQAPPPTFEEAHDALRQEMIQEGVRKAIDEARKGLVVVRYNPDGSPIQPAAPPAAPGNVTPGGATPPTAATPPAASPVTPSVTSSTPAAKPAKP